MLCLELLDPGRAKAQSAGVGDRGDDGTAQAGDEPGAAFLFCRFYTVKLADLFVRPLATSGGELAGESLVSVRL